MKKILSLFVVAGAMVATIGCDEKKPSTSAGSGSSKSSTTEVKTTTSTTPATTPAKP